MLTCHGHVTRHRAQTVGGPARVAAEVVPADPLDHQLVARSHRRAVLPAVPARVEGGVLSLPGHLKGTQGGGQTAWPSHEPREGGTCRGTAGRAGRIAPLPGRGAMTQDIQCREETASSGKLWKPRNPAV